MVVRILSCGVNGLHMEVSNGVKVAFGTCFSDWNILTVGSFVNLDGSAGIAASTLPPHGFNL